MRLIDADKLMLSLNDNYLANSPTGNETLEVQNYRESMCEGLEIAMATVEGAPTVGGWISVKDRLPEKKGDYLTYNTDGIVWPHWYDNGWVDDLGYKMKSVTHWMSLPEPPKEERTE